VLSGSEQNPDFTNRDIRLLLKSRLLGKEPPASIQAFLDQGEDFLTAPTLEDLVAAMNGLTEAPLLDAQHIRAQIEARDRALDNRYGKDAQILAIRSARTYIGDRLIRVAKPAPILDPGNGPLIAVKLHVLTRKTLGGLHCNLQGQALSASGEPIPGLYAAGEVAGFGGGGYHGYNALEGSFLGGCLFSGRVAGRAMAQA